MAEPAQAPESSAVVAPLRVAIVGAGPGGLTLAAILHRTPGVSCVVYELEPTHASRVQGSMLDIHKHSGQLALSKAGLLDEFKKHMMVDATEFYLRDSDKAEVHMYHTEEGKEDPERPEIDRGVLRRILLDALSPETVKWGKKVVDVELVAPTPGSETLEPRDSDSSASSKFKLLFADGTTSSPEGPFDVLVGADGTWSRVRRSDNLYLNPLPPPYSGITCLWSSISNVDTRFPHISKYVGNGSCLTINAETTKCMMAQKNGDGSIKTFTYIPAGEDWKDTIGVDWSKSDGGLKAALDEVAEKVVPEWNAVAKELLTQCDEEDFAIRPLYQFPPGHRWEKKVPGVTLLGDAAHVVTPFTGVGVNLAMHDSYDLAVALEKVVAGHSSLGTALEDYEEAIMQRAGIHAQRTLRNQKTFLGGGGIADAIEKMKLVFSMTEK
ncbi:hypothetical protein H1R20_g9750, partial [Candolleomyces eurysporus]